MPQGMFCEIRFEELFELCLRLNCLVWKVIPRPLGRGGAHYNCRFVFSKKTKSAETHPIIP